MWWFAISATSPRVVGRPEDHVVVHRAGRDHRVHLLAVVGAEVDDDGPVVDRVRLLDRRRDVARVLDPEADTAHRLGPLQVAGQSGRELHPALALLVEGLWPLGTMPR